MSARRHRHRLALAGGAAALTAFALAVPVTAGAAASSAAGPGPRAGVAAAPAPPVRAGAVRTRSARAATAGSPVVSTAPLQYGGGPVVTGHPHVYLIFWGPAWGTATVDSHGDLAFTGDRFHGAGRLQELFKGLGTGGERWSGVMTQYCEGVVVGATSCPNTASHVAYPTGGALQGVYYDIRPIQTAPTASQLAAEAAWAAQLFNVTTAAASKSAQFVILSPHGFHPDNFGLGADFCAWHGATSIGAVPVAFTNLPYVMDLGAECFMDYLNGAAGALDGYTMVEGHEYAETITDPLPTSGWDDVSLGSQGENGDKCPPPLIALGRNAPANVTTSTGSFVLPATRSNDTGGCETAHTVLPLMTVVPDVRGDSQATATQVVAAAGLVVGSVTKVVDCNNLGLVRSQSPTGGTSVAQGSGVALTIGKAPTYPAVCP